MDLDPLYVILRRTTGSYRKGEIIKEKALAGGQVQSVEINFMPHADTMPPYLEKVDVHFMVVGVDKSNAEQERDALLSILKAEPFGERLSRGPSYIEIGYHIGSQELAFHLFALGQVLGLWKIITPATFGFTGDDAEQLAGIGMVMISGFNP